ncbi:MAG: DEAD/DEAH box helicase [Acidobacteriota bacterium]
MTTDFEELGLHPQILQAVTDLGYKTPTPIQSAIIPLMLQGTDVIGQAQTGTGKTAAFGLPILQNLPGRGKNVRALVLSPTRELAIQVADTLNSYGRHSRVRVMPVYGGQSYSTQIRGVRQGVDIIVGTPGRLLDLINRKVLDLSRVDTVVLDEADEMLSMGFIDDIESILNCTSPERQTALFSATMPSRIRQLAGKYMETPQSVKINSKQLTAESVDQRFVLVNQGDKFSALMRIFEVEAVNRALVFVGTRAGTGEVAAALQERGFPAEALNGDLSQNLREQVINRFRQNQITTLVATDVAARGLDIDDISHVFNYDPPQDPEVYVHRIGRTARAGKAGIAISFLTPRERWQLKRIAKFTGQPLREIPIPAEEEIHACRKSQLIDRFEVWLKRKRCSREREIVAELMESGHDLNDIAAVAIKMSRINAKQRPVLPVSELCEDRPVKPERSRGKRQEKRVFVKANRKRSGSAFEKGMVRLSISAGKAQGVRPGDVVGAIAYHGDFPGSVIGAIRVMEDRTLVDVPRQFVNQALAKADKFRFGKKPITMEIA